MLNKKPTFRYNKNIKIIFRKVRRQKCNRRKLLYWKAMVMQRLKTVRNCAMGVVKFARSAMTAKKRKSW